SLLMVYLSNSNVECVMGEVQTDFIRNVHGINDFGGIGVVKFSSGSIGFIKGVSNSPFKFMFELDILGKDGRIKLLNNAETYELYQYSNKNNSAGNDYKSLILTCREDNDYQSERMIKAIKNIIHCMTNNHQPISSAETSLETIKIIHGIINSVKIGNDPNNI
ncbi:TPA: gfo/Idh/MocA family oxidoreductase, partial [Haemophilus influenzae]